jgi:hypothetical protein
MSSRLPSWALGNSPEEAGLTARPSVKDRHLGAWKPRSTPTRWLASQRRKALEPRVNLIGNPADHPRLATLLSRLNHVNQESVARDLSGRRPPEHERGTAFGPRGSTRSSSTAPCPSVTITVLPARLVLMAAPQFSSSENSPP